MSLKIIKAGLLDSLQDTGRTGYRHLGINVTGVMDSYSSCMANILVGNEMNEPVIEFHFPASSILFEKPALIALSGGNFSPQINGVEIPLNHPVYVDENSTLQFLLPLKGARCYMAVRGGFKINSWLGSASTNFKAQAGGWEGRKLMKDDILPLSHSLKSIALGKSFEILPGENHRINPDDGNGNILLLPGQEYSWLAKEAQQLLLNSEFTITLQSDRMGYKLNGPALHKTKEDELVSSPVNFGTIQLLPDGSLMVLMVDHQTTGGYPRIGHVITAHHSRLAQMKPGNTLKFQFTDISTAEGMRLDQTEKLLQLKEQCKIQLNQYFEKYN